MVFNAVRGIVGWLLIVSLAGCSAGLQTYASFDRNVAFSSYKTFGFASNQEPKAEGTFQTLADKYLQQAVRSEMAARGLSEAESPQLLVTFNSESKEKLTQSPTFYGGTRHYVDSFGRVRAVGVGMDAQIVQYTEGTFTIGVVDAGLKQVIWQGVAVGRQSIPKENTLEDDINVMVKKIFKKYPLALTNPET